MPVSRSIGLVSSCLCAGKRQSGTARPRGAACSWPLSWGEAHTSRDVMVQASLDTHRWVHHLGHSRHTHAHTGGEKD